MQKIDVQITWNWPDEEHWLNANNIETALATHCQNTAFDVTELAKVDNADRSITELHYKWAGIINHLACMLIDLEPDTNGLDYANEMIEMVNPYLGLAEE